MSPERIRNQNDPLLNPVNLHMNHFLGIPAQSSQLKQFARNQILYGLQYCPGTY
ncbi:unnamed protein product [Onchocerca flexuosa]|uniref:Uncharacterized protein n=1 Tax=Onchocerca flexuosa TaxID=387005 RepID=A0A183HZL1_9BILA|nr:unnamed protein product [Onchocerca flexuosa]